MPSTLPTKLHYKTSLTPTSESSTKTQNHSETGSANPQTQSAVMIYPRTRPPGAGGSAVCPVHAVPVRVTPGPDAIWAPNRSAFGCFGRGGARQNPLVYSIPRNLTNPSIHPCLSLLPTSPIPRSRGRACPHPISAYQCPSEWDIFPRYKSAPPACRTAHGSGLATDRFLGCTVHM